MVKEQNSVRDLLQQLRCSCIMPVTLHMGACCYNVKEIVCTDGCVVFEAFCSS